mmetsp:Transcript_12805/g.36686  ORF Transcript_12805/g.36686 Transcript_12805/m.36686 type:complete len:321 (+) Transcript_12805:2542-3504(+)
MAVDDVWLAGSSQQKLQRRLREEVKPAGVVIAVVHGAGKHAIGGLNEPDPDPLNNASADKYPGACPIELRLVLGTSQQRTVPEKVVLGEDDLDVVPRVLYGATQGRDDVPHASNLRNRRHLYADIDDVHGRLLHDRTLDWDVVVEPTPVIVYTAVAIGEHKVQRIRVLGNWNRHLVVFPGDRLGHLQTGERLRVPPPVVTEGHAYLLVAVQVCVVRVVADCDILSCDRLLGLCVEHVLHLEPPHALGLIADSLLSQRLLRIDLPLPGLLRVTSPRNGFRKRFHECISPGGHLLRVAPVHGDTVVLVLVVVVHVSGVEHHV